MDSSCSRSKQFEGDLTLKLNLAALVREKGCERASSEGAVWIVDVARIQTAGKAEETAQPGCRFFIHQGVHHDSSLPSRY